MKYEIIGMHCCPTVTMIQTRLPCVTLLSFFSQYWQPVIRIFSS